jgi:uncharacterized damage-inducible protein DinB
MRRPTGWIAVLALAFLAVPALAHDHQEAQPAAAAPAAATGIRAEILRSIDEAESKLNALAEAMPAEKYTWRPGEKVRSVGEVFLHVAGGNYFLPTFWGVKPPEGVNPREFEKSGADKAKVISTMKTSFEHARNAIKSAPEADLDKAIKMFGQDATIREAMLVVASHAHEHLGQSIAYARMNNVVPPWSAGGQ